MGGLIGGMLGVSAGLSAHFLLDDGGLSFEEWLLAFPHEFGADLWAAGGAVLGAVLGALVARLRRAPSSASG